MVQTLTPRNVEYIQQTQAAIGGVTTDTDPYAQTPMASAVLPPGVIGSTYYPNGFMVQAYRYTDSPGPNMYLRTDLFNLETGARLADLGLTISTSSALAVPRNVVVCPIQRGIVGYILGYNYDTAQFTGRIVRETAPSYTTVASNFTLCDISPFSKSREMGFFVAGTPFAGTGTHLYCYRESIDYAGVGTLNTVFAKEYAQTDWATWATGTEPDCMLRVQQFPEVGFGTGITAALIGNFSSGTINNSLVRGRIALIAGPARADRIFDIDGSLAGAVNGQVVFSHTPAANTNILLHDMVVSQEGYIYTVGTGDVVANDLSPLICKYEGWSLYKTASVEHGANGLGDAYVNPQDTHVHTCWWDGSRLSVLDEDSSQLRLFVYDKDLTFISKFTLSSTTAPSTGSRFCGGKYANSWWGRVY